MSIKLVAIQSVLQKIAQNSGTNLQKLFRYAIKSTARRPVHGWDTKKFGAGIVQVDKLLNFNLNSFSSFQNKNPSLYKQGYMFNDDDLSLLIKRIYKPAIFRPFDFLEIFGNEISGLILDMLDEEEDLDDSETKSIDGLISYLKEVGSSTLLKVLHLYR